MTFRVSRRYEGLKLMHWKLHTKLQNYINEQTFFFLESEEKTTVYIDTMIWRKVSLQNTGMTVALNKVRERQIERQEFKGSQMR